MLIKKLYYLNIGRNKSGYSNLSDDKSISLSRNSLTASSKERQMSVFLIVKESKGILRQSIILLIKWKLTF